ncbi:o-succinylbenzoate synthase [Pelagicoccus sp. SDUM812002]|uniref:o-succinylbenzoate synthase n=1 Tax=Pelagicoccus sp. SDUM812002 TaxID=3041266 RepID=UPI00280F70BA|nr:o-succinylbenzoate synthase [Pelagicoccus sp. SDUM812002]MDQ8185133.1 o-succinylbenzoate synthase [Pelagicoccus sp. SDUM812002]
MHRFEYKAYRRHFSGNFSNARESYATREGILIRLEDGDGRVGFGEVAPILGFGTESFATALGVVESFGQKFEVESVLPELGGYPCLIWAIESALRMIAEEGLWPELQKPWPICGLVTNLSDVADVEEKLKMHYQCLKFKIGKGSLLDELKALDRVIEMSDGKVSVRLDANGMLDYRLAVSWLERAAELPVEFIEQPLPRGSEVEMRRLAADFPTPLALDESVGSVDDLKRWRDDQWAGLYVIKPSISGSLGAMEQELESGAGDCVFSSSLESMVGTANAIGFAIRQEGSMRALGFGVESLFRDRNFGLDLGPFLQNGALPSSDTLESLWNLT